MTPEECASLVQAFFAYQSLTKLAVVQHRNDFTKSQSMTLNLLYSAGSLRMSKLADHLAVSKEQASRAVGPLVEQGLVTRSRDDHDGKVVNVSLTEAGKLMVEQLRHEYNEQLSQRLERLSDQERTELIKASQRATDIICQAFGVNFLEP